MQSNPNPLLRTLVIVAFFLLCPLRESQAGGLTLAREDNWLIVRGEVIPGKEIRINYLEAYCRAGSTDADWVQHTVIPHSNELISLSPDRNLLRLRDTLADGLIVEHTISTKEDEVDFRLLAR